MTLHPETPVMASAIRVWEREVQRETAAVESAQRRLTYAKDYLAQLKRQHARQNGCKDGE